MSILSKALSLFKYDPDKDGAKTFNIKQALNDNWDEVLRSVSELDTAIEAEAKRATGQANTVQGNLQAHMADVVRHLTQDERDALRRELDALSASLANKAIIKQVKGSLDDFLADPYPGFGMIIPPATGMPYLDYWNCIVWSDLRETTGTYSRVVYAVSANNAAVWMLLITNGNKFEWIKLATATPPEMLTLPLESGYQHVDEGVSTGTINGKLLLRGCFVQGSAKMSAGETIATLPAGYRPSKRLAVMVFATGTTWCGLADIFPSGIIRWNGHGVSTLPAGRTLEFTDDTEVYL